MLQMRDLPVPVGSKRRTGKKLKSFAGVTIHNAGTPGRGANADAHARNQKNNCDAAVNGWHFTVDEREIVRSIPEDEIAEHSGRRAGNDTTVGIEICDNVDGDIRGATDAAAELAAWLLKRRGHAVAVWKQNIFQHNDWSGKDCPAHIRRGNPYGWAEFVAKVNAHLSSGGQGPAALPQAGAGGNTGNGASGTAGGGDGPGTWALSRVLRLVSPFMRGDDVLTVQTVLGLRGFSPGSCDGIFGAKTRVAVVAFQKAHGLVADGVVGPKTCAALRGGGQASAGLPQAGSGEGPAALPQAGAGGNTGNGASGTAGGGPGTWSLARLLRLQSPMMRGEDVRAVQRALLALSFTVGTAGADGVYGGMTRAAVTTFQRLKGLRQDGVVGRKTCAALGGVWMG